MTSVIEIALQATDNASKVFQQAAAGAGTLGGKLRTAFDGAKAGLSKFGDNLRKGKQQFAEVGDLFNKIGGNIKAAFDAASESAKRLGRTDVTKAIDGMGASFQELQDTLFQIPIGGKSFLDWMKGAAEGATNFAKLVGVVGIKLGQMTGQIDDAKAAQLAANLVTQKAADATAAAVIPLKEMTDAYTNQASVTKYLNDLQDTQKKNAEWASGVYSDAKSAVDDLNLSYYDRLAIETALALASGEVTQEEIDRKNAVLFLTAQYREGNITTAEYLRRLKLLASDAGGARQAINDLSTAINGLPSEHVTTLRMQVENADAIGGTGNRYSTDTTSGSTFGGREAWGGPVMGGQAYLVGERGPEMFVPGSAGRIVPNGAMGGGVVVNISASVGSGVDVEYMAERVARRIQAAQGAY